MSLSPGRNLAQYEIVEPIGKGGMGEVFRAKDTKLGRDVAIKVLPDAFSEDAHRLERFEREAKLLASLNHPGVATLYGLETVDGVQFLAMELVSGETLAERIDRGPIPLEEAIPLAVQIAEALEAAHEKGIIHRDLKPANIKLTEEGKVKILDFGLAKALAGEDAGAAGDLSQSPTLSHHATVAGVILGTAPYMSPEQAKGKPVDRRADVWSFGVVFFEMLSGRRLFTGETVSDVLAAVLRAETDWTLLPVATPSLVRRVLRRCLTRAPKERLRDIGDARLDLNEALSSESVDSETAPVLAKAGWKTLLPWGLAALASLTAFGFLLTRSSEDTAVLIADIAPPPGTRYQFATVDRGPATLSPDGRRIAFSARDTVGRVQLYVRSLDERAARLLPGTEGALEPFWSADSRWVGFYADSKLKKVEASGGPPQDIYGPVSNGRGGGWNRQDVIVFSHGNARLLRISAEGGPPEPVTELDTERGDNSHRYPQFLPDGRHFLYLARNSAGAKHSVIMVGSLDGGASKSVLKSPVAATYASGHLLFLRERTLMAQPFDTERRELTGEAVPIADDIRIHTGAGSAVFSASGDGTLLYQTGTGETSNRLEWVNRTGERHGTLGDDADYGMVRPSPDEQHVAVGIFDASGTSDLWVYELSRQIRSRITFDPGFDGNPVWSPDSATLIFQSNRNLYRKGQLGSGEPELLLTSDESKIPWSVSPDGKLLAYERPGEDTGRDLWILPLEGERKPYAFIQSRFDERSGMFSPDGKWMAYVSNESGRNEVYVDAFPIAQRKQQLSAEGGEYPWWRHDSKEILYQERNGRVVAVGVDAAEDGLVFGKSTLLFEGPPPSQMGWSRTSPFPDAQRFLLVKPAEEEIPQPLTLVVNWTAELEK